MRWWRSPNAPKASRAVSSARTCFVSLHKPPGHGLKLYPRLYRLFRAASGDREYAQPRRPRGRWCQRRPRRRAGTVHGEHGWDVSDPGGTAQVPVAAARYSPYSWDRYAALSGHIESYLVERVGISPRGQRASAMCGRAALPSIGRPGCGSLAGLPDGFATPGRWSSARSGGSRR